MSETRFRFSQSRLLTLVWRRPKRAVGILIALTPLIFSSVCPVAAQQPASTRLLDALTVKRLTRCPHLESAGCGRDPDDNSKDAFNDQIFFAHDSHRVSHL